MVLANLTRLFHPAVSFRDCLWLTERWNTQSGRHSRKQLWYAASISWQRVPRSQAGSQVLCCPGAQIPCKKCVYLGKNKNLLLKLSQTLKGFITSMVMGRSTGSLVWHGCACVSCVTITRPTVIGQYGGSERGIRDPHQNLWPFRRSRIAENSVNLPQLFSIFQLLVVGTSCTPLLF